MHKNVYALVVSLLCLAVFTSCSQISDDTTVTSDVGDVTITEYKDVTDREIDIMEFINLDWIYEEGDEYPHLSKDDILAFDEQAYYIGAVPEWAHAGEEFYFYIGSQDRIMFGYEGFLDYYGSCTPESLEGNVIAESDEVYGTSYEYTGDGNEISFKPHMSFTIPNITYTQFVDIVNNVAEFTSQDVSDFILVSDSKHAHIDDLAELLSIDDPDTVMDDSSLSAYIAYGVSIPNCTNFPWYIGIRWISQERHLAPNRTCDPLDPWSYPIYNRLTITIAKRQ